MYLLNLFARSILLVYKIFFLTQKTYTENNQNVRMFVFHPLQRAEITVVIQS